MAALSSCAWGAATVALVPWRLMLATVYSSAVHGVDAYTLAVEVDVMHSQMYAFAVVGLPDAAVQESRERVRSALKNS